MRKAVVGILLIPIPGIYWARSKLRIPPLASGSINIVVNGTLVNPIVFQPKILVLTNNLPKI